MSSASDWRHKPRPVNLNLLAFRFPITAIVSILHRLAGILLFAFVPLLVWLFSLSLRSAQDFDRVQNWLMTPLSRGIVWIFLIGLIYHLFAGIRHLTMDLGIGESLRAARISAGLTLVLTIIAALTVGVWLW